MPGREAPGRGAVLDWILSDLDRRAGHLNVGVLGAKHLVEALSREGRGDVAYALVNRRGYPGWAHLIEGRTTLSEFWDLHGSHNHVMLGSVDAWFYSRLAGIRPDETQPGFSHFFVAPEVPAGLSRVRAETRTIRGRIAVEWTRPSPEALELWLTVPANTHATVRLPAGESDPVSCNPQRAARHRGTAAAGSGGCC